MTVVSFSAYTPPPRYDGEPWTTVRVEESLTKTGPWTAIEDIALTPTDADPRNPRSRDFTTESATLDAGWYRVTFVDAEGDTTAPSDPEFNGAESGITPRLDEVAALLRARTSAFGGEVGTFTSDTRPTATQVAQIIETAAADIVARADAPIPDRLVGQARWLSTIHAARLIELSYFPEQTSDTDSAYGSLNDIFNPAIAEFLTAVRLPKYTPLA